MNVGLPVTKESLNRELGTVCQQLFTNFATIEKLAFFKADNNNAAFQALGYTVDEAYLAQAAIDDLNQLRTIFNGTATLGSVKDFRNLMRKVWGL